MDANRPSPLSVVAMLLIRDWFDGPRVRSLCLGWLVVPALSCRHGCPATAHLSTKVYPSSRRSLLSLAARNSLTYPSGVFQSMLKQKCVYRVVRKSMVYHKRQLCLCSANNDGIDHCRNVRRSEIYGNLCLSLLSFWPPFPHSKVSVRVRQPHKLQIPFSGPRTPPPLVLGA